MARFASALLATSVSPAAHSREDSMNWKYTDETRQFVYREHPDMSREICAITREDVVKWVEEGNAIEEPDAPKAG